MRYLLPFICVSAQAATLAPDSLVCESPDHLEFIASERIPGPGGQKLMTQIEASAKGYRLMAQQSDVYKSLAVREEQIRDYKLRGSSAAQAAAADSDAKSATDKAVLFEKAGKSCAAAGPAQIDVIERKPISGLAKVRMEFNGSKAELWTTAGNVKD